VLRGDQGAIVIGQETSIQDGTIAHATAGWSTTSVGDRVTVGHRVVLHGCTVGSDCLIGMGAILLDGSEISAESMVGAGSLVPSGRRFPPRSLIMGSPARVVRQLSDDDIAQWIANGHRSYQVLGAIYGGWDG
jgi:carbonic anhydrase/acetyltransferase-like protein (isoleucine patch superfamily)